MTEMKLKSILLATTMKTVATAFDNQTGWKMDGENIALDGEGNPIFINADGAEQSIKTDTVPNLNRDAKQLRTAKEAAETELAKYRDENGKLLDPVEAKKAVETVSKIDAKTLIDAGKVDEVKAQIEGQYKEQLTEKDAALNAANTAMDQMRIDSLFAGSDFIRDQVAVPREFFEASMRQHFKVEDGKIAVYDKSGNRVMSKKSLGEQADPHEAMQILVDQHPQRDTILKAPDAAGMGGSGNGGNRGQGNTMKRDDFNALTPAKQAEIGQKLGKGEITLVD